MVPIEQKDWTEEDRASKLGQNHPLDSTKRLFLEPDPLQAIEQAEQAGKKQAAKWAAPQFEAIRIAPRRC